MIHFFRHPIAAIPLPERFNNPFSYTPHPLCVMAAEEVQTYLKGMDFWERCPQEGKMFGVLAVHTPAGETGFLAAFSGILDGEYLHPYFVPPVYNLQRPESFFREEEQRISALNEQITRLEGDVCYRESLDRLTTLRREAEKELAAARDALRTAKMARDEKRRQQPGIEEAELLVRESQHQKAEYKRLADRWKKQMADCQVRTENFRHRIEALKTERKQRSATLQQRLFAQFRFRNARGETKDLCDLFRAAGHPQPPAGAGECAAPKLLQFAYLHHLRPLAMAEFWWGNPAGTEVRRPGHFYPACQGKCGPILRFMLEGLPVEESFYTGSLLRELAFPEIVYEDEQLVVVNKPEGMLSVPGKSARPSLYDLARQRYPSASGPLLVHRLDLATSGLLLIAKDKAVHERLQRQFIQRTVRKVYVALLDGQVTAGEGMLELPLCPDPYDRPRQLVSEKYGKPAITRYRVLQRTDRYTRVAFYPETGRTHQLRVQAAHPSGLNCPILGDELYGKKADRLYLHAETLEFTHPSTATRLCLKKPPEF